MYKITMIILISILTLAGCGGQKQETVPAEEVSGQQPAQEEMNKLVTTLDINQQDNEITFAVHVENTSDNAIKLVFSSGKKYEITVKNGDGTQLYNSSQGKMYTQAIQEVMIEPHSKITWEDTWQPGDLQPGKYNVEVKVAANQTEGISKTLEIK